MLFRLTVVYTIVSPEPQASVPTAHMFGHVWQQPHQSRFGTAVRGHGKGDQTVLINFESPRFPDSVVK